MLSILAEDCRSKIVFKYLDASTETVILLIKEGKKLLGSDRSKHE